MRYSEEERIYRGGAPVNFEDDMGDSGYGGAADSPSFLRGIGQAMYDPSVRQTMGAAARLLKAMPGETSQLIGKSMEFARNAKPQVMPGPGWGKRIADVYQAGKGLVSEGRDVLTSAAAANAAMINPVAAGLALSGLGIYGLGLYNDSRDEDLSLQEKIGAAVDRSLAREIQEADRENSLIQNSSRGRSERPRSLKADKKDVDRMRYLTRQILSRPREETAEEEAELIEICDRTGFRAPLSFLIDPEAAVGRYVHFGKGQKYQRPSVNEFRSNLIRDVRDGIKGGDRER